MLNISRILPSLLFKKKTHYSRIDTRQRYKLPNLKTINAKIIKNILCLISDDFVKPPSPGEIFGVVLDIT
jgi:hypothetical protein